MRKLFTLLCLLQSYFGIAQFNDSTHYMVKLASSGNLNHTSDGFTYLLNNSIQYGIKKEAFVLNFNSSWVYGNSLNVLTNNDVVSTLDFNIYDHKYKDLYYWGLVNFTSSFSLKINEQIQNGVGAAYKLINKNGFMLGLSDGILFESSDIFLEDNSRLTYHTFRNSLRLQFNVKYKELVVFTSQAFWQPSLSYGNDYIITTNANLAIKIWKWLSFNTSLTYNKVSRTDKENFILTYGIVAQRFF
jgi:hypothetical protein